MPPSKLHFIDNGETDDQQTYTTLTYGFIHDPDDNDKHSYQPYLATVRQVGGHINNQYDIDIEYKCDCGKKFFRQVSYSASEEDLVDDYLKYLQGCGASIKKE